MIFALFLQLFPLCFCHSCWGGMRVIIEQPKSVLRGQGSALFQNCQNFTNPKKKIANKQNLLDQKNGGDVITPILYVYLSTPQPCCGRRAFFLKKMEAWPRYWPIRGLAGSLRMLLEYSGAVYEDRHHDADSWFGQTKPELAKSTVGAAKD